MNNNLPKVSVVIPAYNVARYIGETLRSVFAQTFTDYEVIVVNDGSPDTEQFELALEPFIDRLRYVKQENLGASAARNEGLRSAQGEFIAFLDADDLWLPTYLEEQIKFIREHDCDLVCADSIILGDPARVYKTFMDALMESAPAIGRVTFLGLVSAEQCLITSGIVVRRQLIFDVGLFDEALRNAQDFDLWLRLAKHGAQLMYRRQALLCYRYRSDSLTGDEINSHARELRVLDKVERSYNLTPAERAEVFPVIRSRTAILEFELGKLHLAHGDIELARSSFAKSSSAQRSWKTQAALWFLRLAPGLMQAFCLRRMRAAGAM
jgi:glycosyltransferase involved in cell wall biosynthesis